MMSFLMIMRFFFVWCYTWGKISPICLNEDFDSGHCENDDEDTQLASTTAQVFSEHLMGIAGTSLKSLSPASFG